MLTDSLDELIGKRVAVVCVGNPLRGDDGFGPAVAARLSGPNVFDAESVPENILPKAARQNPEVVLFVDAADFGAPPGTLRLVDHEELARGDFSTHAASLATSAEFIRAACGARSLLLVVQARQTALGSAMSAEVAGAVDETVRLLAPLVK